MKVVTKSLNILVVDDYRLISDGLCSLLAEEPFIRKVNAAQNGDEALQILSLESYNIVITDINMQGMSGIELTRKIRSNFPHTKVIALSMHNDLDLIEKMLQAGASGFIFKSTDISDLFGAITTVAEGGCYLSQEAREVVMKNIYYNKPTEHLRKTAKIRLSPRERDFLALLAREMTNQQIAAWLQINEKTVDVVQNNIMVKTKSRNFKGLMEFAKNLKIS
jgi:DNA-binding NarL/FixJ family response regulator